MMSAYSELYLSDAKSALAEFFDYGVVDCEMDADMLAQIFAFSEYGKGFERGNPGIIGGMSGTELFVKMMEKAYPDFKPAPAKESPRHIGPAGRLHSTSGKAEVKEQEEKKVVIAKRGIETYAPLSKRCFRIN